MEAAFQRLYPALLCSLRGGLRRSDLCTYPVRNGQVAIGYVRSGCHDMFGQRLIWGCMLTMGSECANPATSKTVRD